MNNDEYLAERARRILAGERSCWQCRNRGSGITVPFCTKHTSDPKPQCIDLRDQYCADWQHLPIPRRK